ncbi:DUF294 nucleotidyltransferase-like domain-containing protein [Paenibacillus sp. OAE614]|uniref:DUF294 nucleotidyltransferase-like domain-containing protein n=1 Tax=Paenibacillus sp. OAE614 TaxID=2663804 RepID=UPI00178A0239
MEPLKSESCDLDLGTIAYANSREELRSRRLDCQEQLQEMFADMPIGAWSALVNEMHDLIAARAVDICERELEEAGYGLPPVSYAFVVFGSAGRRESTLWSDQDNGLIISDEPDAYKEAYFQIFGQRLSDLFEYLGYEKCKGKVMCSEPLWRKTLEGWKTQLSRWRNDFSWEPVRYLIIATDMRYISGDRTLSESWKAFFGKCLDETPELAIAILRNTVRHKATLNLLGQVVTERFGEHAGDFDVKYGVYIPIVNSVRYMALQQGVKESSTLKRLERLMVLDGGNMLLENVQRAFLTALMLRSTAPHREERGIFMSSGYIPQKELKKRSLMYELRESLTVVRRTHRALQRQLRFAERRRP